MVVMYFRRSETSCHTYHTRVWHGWRVGFCARVDLTAIMCCTPRKKRSELILPALGWTLDEACTGVTVTAWAAPYPHQEISYKFRDTATAVFLVDRQ